MSVTVWAKDAIDQDRIVITEVSASIGERIVTNLSNIYPDGQFWTEED
ncbi:Uncharacterised protein [Mycobacteroides abscessus subsp. massiliense]|nr:hypothetical protein [Mycobacteroides abscessus]SHX43683.1 Uncharacterised protein [Mycobacteroides abscessus subsp. abscessus]SKM67705.1 Uncharacterised protein [Mycobacteroides abscessus subsp. massiliense]SKN34026.1 Uncharacterised protein [Mycobacteroides abscessus subsp. massiliense]SKP16003.1 Uncharacterised protein [Mycobacteroides abscessus subsp. massiliense]SKP57492.1 Uncharacterised protein [Mycobacteroides abscessus subsp. massiliense]